MITAAEASNNTEKFLMAKYADLSRISKEIEVESKKGLSLKTICLLDAPSDYRSMIGDFLKNYFYEMGFDVMVYKNDGYRNTAEAYNINISWSPSALKRRKISK